MRSQARFLHSAVVGMVCLLALLAMPHAAAETPPAKTVATVESSFGDMVEAYCAFNTIDSGIAKTYGGKDRTTWEKIYKDKRKTVAAQLAKINETGLSKSDARAVAQMRNSLEFFTVGPHTFSPTGKCADAAKPGLEFSALHDALYACFEEFGNHIQFEGTSLNRVSALSLLEQIKEPERRKTLFLAFVPLWDAINAKNQPDSPYRRLITISAANADKPGSPVVDAAASIGVKPAEVESWLEQVLAAWRDATSTDLVEPWDYRYRAGQANRMLEDTIPQASLLPITRRYYRDLAADLETLGVLHDLEPRSGKAPLAYTDYARPGRMVSGKWQPAVARVSASYGRGGLSNLNELVHEDGHAIHYSALRTRPAYLDADSSLFMEAFADVPSWSTYDPAWQQKYLGTAAPQAASMRSLYSGVMMDVAWALFEIRMLKNPASDPNVVWTDITSKYLHITPHPELAWWAVRVQLVDAPGYMVNYGLGALLTADMRHRIQSQLGPFPTGDERWYPWVSERLLKFGAERDTPEVLTEFLGRPVSPEPLIDDLKKLAK